MNKNSWQEALEIGRILFIYGVAICAIVGILAEIAAFMMWGF